MISHSIPLVPHDSKERELPPLAPRIPFAWPELRVQLEMLDYRDVPAFDGIVRNSRSLLAVIAAPAGRTVEVLERWMAANETLRANVVLAVYPTCSTQREHMDALLDLQRRYRPRLEVGVRTHASVTHRPTSLLLFECRESQQVVLAVTPSEDLGGDPRADGKLNLVLRADPGIQKVILDEFKSDWVCSLPIEDDGVRALPYLVLPDGTEEAARLWREYVDQWARAFTARRAVVDPKSGVVKLMGADGRELESPAKSVGLEEPDPLTLELAAIYERGHLVSIDKLSRVPPLDAPINVRQLGDAAELQAGGVRRTVRSHVSIFAKADLDAFEKCRRSVRETLNRFTFALADGMRWMPHTARTLFESEIEQLEQRGEQLVGTMIQGDVDKFLASKRDQVAKDVSDMLAQLGRPTQVPDALLNDVMGKLGDRLRKSHEASFRPTLTYTPIAFSGRSGSSSDPWGQASTLLCDIVSRPREAVTSAFFFRGFTVPKSKYIEAMDIAEDTIVPVLGSFEATDRAELELALIAKLRKAGLEPRQRCEFAWRILRNERVESIEAEIETKEIA